MAFASKIVIHSKSGATNLLEAMVEEFITEGVEFIAVAGIDCARIEDLIDEFIVGDGSNETRFILTSSHPGESLEEVLEFSRLLETGGTVEPQVIEI